MPDHAQELSPTKRAILELRELRARLEEQQRRGSEPIAIVGIGCRFPGGVNDPDSFWRLLQDGVDAITEVPRDRWDVDAYYHPDPDAPGKMSTRWGGFLDGVDRFDADFFGISSREASTLDPQQRLLLEVTWEALEHAGYAADRLFGSLTGVFVGIGSFDYMQLQLQQTPPALIDAYLATGGCHSVASGRLSYVLGLRGPSVSLDTACSSSLVAVHMACQSLRAGECNLALAGGVNVILAPELLINFSKAHMMAPDGRCKVFDAAANGFVRAEGCGVVVLQRLSDAMAQRANILAVVRGSAINQDGRSSGLTAPNGPSQQAVIRAALASAGVGSADIGYVEAHGTGTTLGDPIELHALGAVLAESRSPASPVPVGSVKTNIGHAEAAAGIAGLIKVVLAMHHDEIPPHLHFRDPSPHVDWQQVPITVPTVSTPWPRRESGRVAGVSSFGFSGTNAHVIVGDAPRADPVAPSVDRPLHLVTVSARNQASLRELAGRYASHLEQHPDLSIADVGFTANVGRSALPHRAAITAQTSADAISTLRALAVGRKTDAICGLADAQAPDVVFLFAGQGSQYPQMGRQLYETQPTFRAAMDRCDELLRPHLDRSILSVMFSAADAERLLDETAYTQPALFALEYSLAELWQSWGVRPAVALGHSLGEDIAACVAGVMDLADGLALIAARGRLMQTLPRDGDMVAVFADEAVVREVAERKGLHVSIAALNGPAHVTVSGERAAVRALVADVERTGIRTKKLTTSHAFHSALMDPILDPYERLAREVRYSDPTFDIVSNLTGEIIAAAELTNPTYWRRHVRETVRFSSGIRHVYDRGYRVFVEIGPNSTLTSMARNSVTADDVLWVNSLRKDQEWPQLLDAVSKLHVRGVSVQWDGFDRDYHRRRVALPTYPFKRARHWFSGSGPALQATAAPREIFATIEAHGREQADQAPLDLSLSTYPAKWAALDKLSHASMLGALQTLGVFRGAGDSDTPQAIIEACGIRPAYHKLVNRWLGLLHEAGLLDLAPDGAYVATGVKASALLETARRECATALADIPVFLAYVERCGSLLPEVLTGRLSVVETLFPGGSQEMADHIYREWAMSRYFNAIVRAVAESFVSALPSGRHLSVLEIGAGTGATTAAVAPSLPRDRTSYVFTDVSEYFLAAATRRFASEGIADYRLLDIERKPEEQGYTLASFDIVIAANVLHATKRIEETVAHARSLVAPGGILVVYEITDPPRWLDISFGLFEGWQRFEDGLRNGTPTLPRDGWTSLLQASGFERVIAFPEAGSPADALRAHVIVAQAPGDPAARAADSGPAREREDAGDEAGVTDPAVAGLLAQLAVAPAAERRDLLVDFVRGHVSAVVRRDSADVIDRRERLMDLGVDSLMAVELRDRLGAGLPLTKTLPPTLVFDYPSIEAIAALIGAHLPGPAEVEERSDRPAPVERRFAREAEVHDLSDAEVEELLVRKLETM